MLFYERYDWRKPGRVGGRYRMEERGRGRVGGIEREERGRIDWGEIGGRERGD